MVVIDFGSPWGVSGFNACCKAEALDRPGEITGRYGYVYYVGSRKLKSFLFYLVFHLLYYQM